MEQKKEFIDKILDIFFSKSNFKYLIILLIIALILRIIASVNIAPNADEVVHAPHAINFINSGKLQIMDEAPIWFFLTDLIYKIFEVNMFSARFLSILFGSLSILVIYLIGKELFNKRVALFASFLLTFSAYHIIMTLAEMDIAMTFFFLLSMYFLIKALKTNKNKLFLLSWIFLGIAILTKTIALMFIPAYVIFLIYYNLKNKSEVKVSKKLFKTIFIFAIVIFVMVIPILTFNYLLYKDKGIGDLQFSRFLGLGKDTYASIEATLKPFRVNDLFLSYNGRRPGLLDGISFYYVFDFVLFILAIFGLIIIFNRNKTFSLLLLLIFLFPFIFLSGTSLLPYHFAFGIPIFALLAANTLDFIIEKTKKIRIKTKIITYLLLILILVSSILFINKQGVFSGKSEVTNIMSYNKDNIENDALVIVDTRIYRGRIVFMFNDKHYLEASQFNDAVGALKQSPQQETSIKTYFIECITDDCGWGTIAQQPDLNQSMEDLTDFFKNNSQSQVILTNTYNEPYFNVYQTNLLLKKDILDLADSTHNWFFYPLRYEPKEKVFDNYKTSNFLDKSLDIIAHFILYLEALIVSLSIILLFVILIKQEGEEIEA
mgnify:FL=1